MQITKKERLYYNENQLRFTLLIFRPQVLIPAFAARGCTNRIACIAMHTYFHVE
jgi:hypothetical protein